MWQARYLISISLLLLIYLTTVDAANPDSGKEIFKLCTQCHGTEGWGASDGGYPQLAGQHQSVIEKQIRDIAAGRRDNPKMLPIAEQLIAMGPQALADVAAYISLLKMNPSPDVGEAEDEQLEMAAQINADKCAGCHGPAGEGNSEKYYPLIQGQNYEYLLRQLKNIRDGKRKNSNVDMVKQLAGLNDRDLELLADYYSRIEPPQNKIAPFNWRNPDFQ